MPKGRIEKERTKTKRSYGARSEPTSSIREALGADKPVAAPVSRKRGHKTGPTGQQRSWLRKRAMRHLNKCGRDIAKAIATAPNPQIKAFLQRSVEIERQRAAEAKKFSGGQQKGREW